MTGVLHYWSVALQITVCGAEATTNGVTTDKASVTCERCKKALGIVEMKKVVIG